MTLVYASTVPVWYIAKLLVLLVQVVVLYVTTSSYVKKILVVP